MRLATLLLGLAGAAFAASAGAAPLQVFACEPEWAALAREVGAGRIEAWSATTAFQDVHRVQARPSLIAKYRQADLVVCTGADLEVGWLPALVQKGNNPSVRPGTDGHFEAAAFVTLRDVPERVDRSMGDVHPQGNPHLHLDPRNMIPVARALAARLSTLDPAGAAAYTTALAAFEARWTEAVRQWTGKAKALHGVKVVGAHRSWSYLWAWLGVVEVALLEPKPGIPPSASHLADVLQRIQGKDVRAVVHAAYESKRPSEWLAERAGLHVIELPYTVGGAEGADDLAGLFAVTVDRLLEAAQPARR